MVLKEIQQILESNENPCHLPCIWQNQPNKQKHKLSIFKPAVLDCESLVKNIFVIHTLIILNNFAIRKMSSEGLTSSPKNCIYKSKLLTMLP